MATTQGAQSGRTRSAGAQGGGQSKTTSERKPKTMTVHLPLVTAEFRRPDLRLPRLPEVNLPRLPEVSMSRLSSVRDDVTQSVSGAVSTVRSSLPSRSAVRSSLPSREQMAYYGGLGLLTAFSVIEWPVAMAIGAGTVIAQRAGGQQSTSTPPSSSKSSSSRSSRSTSSSGSSSSSSSSSSQSRSRSDRSSG